MAAFMPFFICGVCALLFASALYVLKVFKQSSALNLPSSPFPLPIICNLHLLDIRRQDKSLMKELWKTTQQVTITIMWDLGMGKHLGEERMLEELHFLIELITSFEGRPFQLWFLNIASSNITFAVPFGRRFDYGDPTFLTLLRVIDEVMHLLCSPSVHISPQTSQDDTEKVEVCVILKKCIKESKENMNENNLKSYIDALVLKQEELNKSDTLFHDDDYWPLHLTCSWLALR